MRAPSLPLVVAADHPSLDGAVERFLAALRAERRFLGPSASMNPAPRRSLVDALAQLDDGFRLAAVRDGHVLGLARVDRDGDLHLAVAAEHRGCGVGTHLARHVVDRARVRGYGRLCLRTSHRSRPTLALAAQMGFMVIDRGRGRLDLVLDLAPASTSA